MIKLPIGVRVGFTSADVTVGFEGSSDLETTGVVAIFKDEDRTLYLKQADGTLIEIPPGYLYLQITERA